MLHSPSGYSPIESVVSKRIPIDDWSIATAMKRQWQRYKELELISDEPKVAASSYVRPLQQGSWLKVLWQIVDVALFRNLESRVWQSVDRQTGQVCWYLYDPDTGRTSQLTSETEVRQWLEKVFRR